MLLFSNIMRCITCEYMKIETDIIKNCPQNIVNEFESIISEVKNEYPKRFSGASPDVYLEYSKGWHYILAQKILSCNNVRNALDIGALFGVMSIFMSKHGMRVTSLDRYVGEIPDSIKIKYNLDFIFANLETLSYPPIPSNKYDLVLMSEILEHLNYNPIPVLLMIRKAMTRDGYLVINTPDNDNYPAVPEGPVARYMHHLNIPLYENGSYRQSFPHSKQYTDQEFAELLTNCGFDIQEIIKFNHEGIHLLAIARPNQSWVPAKKVMKIMHKQFPSYVFPDTVNSKISKSIGNFNSEPKLQTRKSLLYLPKMTLITLFRHGPIDTIKKISHHCLKS